MYSTCLFCAANLGRNEAIEAFPVGSRVAFDAWRGRLWAICARCGRWNLAPLEERWEAVEAAEKLFVDARQRVHSENIGLAKLPDGTRLVRVGEALPGELAAWRYGSQFISRRRRNLAVGALAVATGGAIVAGLPLILGAGIPIMLLNTGMQAQIIYQHRVRQQRVIHRVPAERSPTGVELLIRRVYLSGAVLEPAADGDVGLRLTVPRTYSHAWKKPASGWVEATTPPVHIAGDEARRVLARAMSDYNAKGARSEEVQQALKILGEAGGAEAFARRATQSRARITLQQARARRTRPYTLRQVAGTFKGDVLPVERYRDLTVSPYEGGLSKLDALALEMALNEESERRALEGELAALEAAWREAEEIAHIADQLPDVPAPRQLRPDSQQQE